MSAAEALALVVVALLAVGFAFWIVDAVRHPFEVRRTVVIHTAQPHAFEVGDDFRMGGQSFKVTAVPDGRTIEVSGRWKP